MKFLWEIYDPSGSGAGTILASGGAPFLVQFAYLQRTLETSTTTNAYLGVMAGMEIPTL